METIVTIIGFVLFSVLMDAFESRKKKKKRSVPVPEPRAETPQQARGKTRATRRTPPQPSLPPQPRPEAQVRLQNTAPRVAAAIAPPSSDVPDAAAGRHFPDPAQLYSNALLDAVAYAEILQPPKAYQYMATRSCVSRWPGNNR